LLVDAGFLCDKSVMLTDMMKGVKVKVRGKVHPRTGHEGPEGSRCILLLFL